MSTPKHRPQRSRTGPVIWMIVAAVIVVGYLADSGLFEGGSADGTSGAVFGPRESGRLVERLDAAWRAQGICYGWRIDSGGFSAGSPVTPSYSGTFRPAPIPSPSVPSAPGSSAPTTSSPSPSPSPSASSSPAFPVPGSPAPSFPPPTTVPGLGVETGSNFGVGIDPATTPACATWAVFTADYGYDAVEDEWTSVDVAVESNLARPPSTADLTAAGITTSSLLGDDSTARLADAIGALPMIVAERGVAPAVPEAAAASPPPGDQVAMPGIGRYIWMGLAIIMIIGGVLWIVAAAVRSRRRQETPHA